MRKNRTGKSPGEVTKKQETGKAAEEASAEESAGEQAVKLGIAVAIHKSCAPFLSTVQVIPKVVTLGMGCRKNKEPEGIEKRRTAVWNRKIFFPQAVEQLQAFP